MLSSCYSNFTAKAIFSFTTTTQPITLDRYIHAGVSSTILMADVHVLEMEKGMEWTLKERSKEMHMPWISY